MDQNQIESQPQPNNSAAEAAVLGALMGDVNQADAVRYITELEPSDFYDSQHRDIFVALVEIVKSGAMPDLVLAYERSKCEPAMLAQIRAAGCMPSQIPHYLPILHNSRRGRLLKKCVSEAQISLSKSEDYEQIEGYLIDKLTKSRTEKTKILPVNEGLTVAGLLADDDPVCMVPTGIEELDIALGGGIACGEVCILAADTSTGKSATGIKIALSALAYEWSVQYESYEMQRRELWQRSLSYWTGISITKFRNRHFNDFDAAALTRAEEEMRLLWQRFTSNTKSTTPSELMGLAKVQRMQTGCPYLLIVDTAQRMRADKESASDTSNATKIIHGLKDIALQCEIPILVMWQFSRPVGADKKQGRKPTIFDLRDTGQAEQVADIVVLASRDNYFDKTIPWKEATLTFDLAKGRDGCTLGPVDVPWLSVIDKGYRREPGED